MPILRYASSTDLEEEEDKIAIWPRVLAITETLLEYMFVSKKGL